MWMQIGVHEAPIRELVDCMGDDPTGGPEVIARQVCSRVDNMPQPACRMHCLLYARNIALEAALANPAQRMYQLTKSCQIAEDCQK